MNSPDDFLSSIEWWSGTTFRSRCHKVRCRPWERKFEHREHFGLSSFAKFTNIIRSWRQRISVHRLPTYYEEWMSIYVRVTKKSSLWLIKCWYPLELNLWLLYNCHEDTRNERQNKLSEFDWMRGLHNSVCRFLFWWELNWGFSATKLTK